ncbi:peroxidase-related enzyme (plasmid) [Aquamicrobium terrae]
MTKVVHEFTTEIPIWKPYVTPLDLADASQEQLDALKVTPSNTKVSEYVLVLAHDAETLKHRSPLFNGVMYNRGGLSRAEREIGAIGASIVNRCIYCAAVHASRYSHLTKQPEVIEAIFIAGADAKIEPRLKAILRFAINLSKCPSETDAVDMAALVEAGLNKEEILDLILSTSLFSWANRLMHTLGEPIEA